MRTALTIAGSDPGGGAGIQADLKTFAAHGLYGTSAITAVTVQNTRGVTGVHVLPAELVAAQIEAVLDDIPPDAVKVGMLGSAAVAAAVADRLAARRPPHVVLDTVLAATSGAALLDLAGLEVLRRSLVPLVEVLTVNTEEAFVLTGTRVTTVTDSREAARHLASLGARAVVVKGGHLSGQPVDVLCLDGALIEYPGERVESRRTHGTGCTFASAIAARLALGDDVAAAVAAAKAYVARAIAQAPLLGTASGGHGPLNHFPS